MHFAIRIILLILVFGVRAHCAWAFDGVSVDVDSQAGFTLGRFSYYLEDQSKKLTIEEVLNQDQRLAWLKNEKEHPSFGYSDSAYWLKVILNHSREKSEQRLLEISYALLNSLKVYQVVDNKITASYNLGSTIPYKQRPIEYRNFLVPLNLPANSSVILYIRVAGESSSLQVPMQLWDKSLFLESALDESIVMGLFYGIMVIMICYNFFIYLTTRIVSYLWYVLYVISVTILMASVNGHVFQYLWPDDLKWNLYIPLTSIAGGVVFPLAFTVTFLNLKETAPRIATLLMMIILGAVVVLSCSLFIPYRATVFLLVFLVVLGGSTCFFAALHSLYKGNKQATFFVLGWTAVFWGAGVFGLSKINVLPRSDWFEYSVQVSCALEVLLFSLALGNSLNQERREKKIALVEQSKIEVANKAKSQFFAGMSHEFRTPLTAILGFTELAVSPGVTEDERLDYVKTTRTSAKHMLQLINDVLDLSKIEAQKLDVERIATDLVSLCGEIKGFTSILADEKGISFDVDIHYPIPARIVTDPTRLRQALINLCSNAIKFTEKGGVKCIVYADQEQQQICFAIEDTGIGIKPEQRTKLFNAYGQAEASTSRLYGGTGLGLWLSKTIAAKLGGDITVESEYGKGSVFTLKVAIGHAPENQWLKSNPSVDMREAEVKQSEDTHQEIVDQTEGFTVLLVEDNPVNQKLIQIHLEKMGASVMLAQDGIEAIAKSLGNQIDLILMDMNMPLLDGRETVKLLREKGLTNVIYALTGDVSNDAIDEALNAGCDGHLGKPINIEAISQVLHKLQAAV